MIQTPHSVSVKISLLTTKWSRSLAVSLLLLCSLRRALYIALFLVPCSIHAQVPSYVPTSGLVGWWPFNGNANDESGNGNNGTVNGATLTTDRFGVANKAYSFDGTSSNIVVSDNALLRPTNITISVWVKTDLSPLTGTILSKTNFSNAQSEQYVVDIPNTGLTRFFIKRNSACSPGVGWNSLITNTGAITANTWTIIVYTYDGTTMKGYINGVMVQSFNPSAGAIDNCVGGNLNIGRYWNSDLRYFKGQIDDLAIYNRALTQQEITNLYTSSVPPSITTSASPSIINCGESSTLTSSSTSAVQPCIKADLPATLQTGLVCYWPFCGNANDASGNNNNGTVNGATLTTDRFGNSNNSYYFNGNSRIENNNSSLRQIVDGLNSFSVGMWFLRDFSGNTGGAASSQAKVLFAFDGNNSYPYKRVWATIGQLNDSITQIQFTRNNSITGAPEITYNTGIFIEPNTWNHLLITFNGSLAQIYLNNILLSSIYSGSPLMPISILGPDNNVIGFTIGDNNQNNVSNFSGKLDDIAIYNRALTATEVQQLYSLGTVNYSWSTGATTPSISVTPAQTTAYTCTATNSAGSTTSSVTVNVADSLSWTGLFDTDWHKPCNWSPQFVPKCCNNVVIPFTSNQPIVSGVAAAEDLTIYATNGAQLTVNNGANLQIADCPTTITTAACPSLAVLITTAVSSITLSTAISGGTITYQGESAITARGICWSTSQNPTLANSFTTNGTGVGTFTSNLTGLTAGTTYYVRGYATNASGTSYGNEVSFATQTLAAQYPAGSVFCASGPTDIVDVTNPATGKTWMDRNLGASQAATSSTDANSYGDLYQWGRRSDGHQCRTSATTAALSSVDQPGNGNFILAPTIPNDWRSPQNNNLWQGINGVNNPCPSGYRIATEIEFNLDQASWSQPGSFWGMGPLKFTKGGRRNQANGVLENVNSRGGYWTSSVNGTFSRNFTFTSGNSTSTNDRERALGYSIRCIKETVAIVGSINCGDATQTGIVYSSQVASGVTVSLPYSGGNGGFQATQIYSSTGVTGLTATLSAGLVASGSGNLMFTITGTPSAPGTANFVVTLGGQTCTISVSVNNSILVAQYQVGSVFCASGPTAIVDVTNPITGKTWMDRNLGATQAATSSTDAAAYGDLYQWGRGSDGHQCRTSATTATLSSTDTPANGNFIIAPSAPSDWRSPQNLNLWQGVNGVNNPCPSGYRIPMETEINSERLSWSVNTSVGAFDSPLKLPMAGYRNSIGSLVGNTNNYYWNSAVSGINSRYIAFGSGSAFMSQGDRANGFAVRCIKDASVIPAILGTLDCGSTSTSGILTSGVVASGVSATVPYSGGNGGSYSTQTIVSTGVTGLTATLNSGILANGTGSFTLAITGTPTTSGTASFALTIGGQSCVFTISVQIALAAQYPVGSVFCASGPTTIVDVTNPTTGKTWMDRNLGATQAATSPTDVLAYGDLYQWGRGNDGHQCRTSPTTSTLSATNQPGNGNFILIGVAPNDWRSPQNGNLWQGINGVNNPCPLGYRIPTSTELNAERASWSTDNATGAFGSVLKFTRSGRRVQNSGAIGLAGNYGFLWSSTVSGISSIRLDYSSFPSQLVAPDGRAGGESVRCIKN